MTPHEYYIDRKTPDYYPTMYLDGYSPTQIIVAKHRQMFQEHANDNNFEVVFKSEVKIK